MTTQEAAEPPAPDLRDTGARIDALIDALGTGGLGGPSRARERAEELVRVVTELYGAGLERLLEIVYDSGRLDEELLGLLARDELVSSLLLVHGLHPHDVRTRVEQALDDVRPYLGSHGGDVELVGITDEGTVRLRLLGSCDGCPSSSVTLELAVQDAIEAAAPEVMAIEVEAAPEQHPGLIPVDTLRSRLDARPEAAGSDWHPVPEADGLADGAAATVTVQQERLHVSRVGSDVFAFRDRC
ncbi:MAG: NifU family protein, partial [Nocardioides sp.]